jgi:3'-phosphoadenosine 5'-phosphosulfate (PAPS) 3'-phosphatase
LIVESASSVAIAPVSTRPSAMCVGCPSGTPVATSARRHAAAPVAVALAAGLHASRIDGSRLVYNRPDPLLPDLVVCRPELAERVLAAAYHSRS